MKFRIAPGSALIVASCLSLTACSSYSVQMGWPPIQRKAKPAPEEVHELNLVNTDGTPASFPQYWKRNTLVNVYSTTKTITALTALLVADRGLIDFDAPVARYWPEFAANGKDRVKVSHLMSHSSGLSGWKEPIAEADLYDWEKVTSLLAAQAPFWEPGTAPG